LLVAFSVCVDTTELPGYGEQADLSDC